MDAKFDSDLVSFLLDDLTARALLSALRVSEHGRLTAADLWNDADDTIFYYEMMNEVNDNADDVRLFSYAEYLTFIPGGEEGYRIFDGYIRETRGISAAEWRYNAFASVLGRCKECTPAHLARLKRFFENRTPAVVHYDNLDEACAALLALFNKLAASLSEKDTMYELLDLWQPVLDFMTDEFPQRKAMPFEELMSLVPDPAPLTPSAADYVKSTAARIEKIIA